MPTSGNAAASTALPQPPKTSQKVPSNSATARLTTDMSIPPVFLNMVAMGNGIERASLRPPSREGHRPKLRTRFKVRMPANHSPNRGSLMRFILAVLSNLSVAPGADYPQQLPSPGGEVTLPDADARSAHDDWRYAAARRVGDTIYVSGVIVNRRPNEGTDVAAFKVSARRALNRLKTILEAAGSDWQHVTMINSFHV